MLLGPAQSSLETLRNIWHTRSTTLEQRIGAVENFIAEQRALGNSNKTIEGVAELYFAFAAHPTAHTTLAQVSVQTRLQRMLLGLMQEGLQDSSAATPSPSQYMDVSGLFRKCRLPQTQPSVGFNLTALHQHRHILHDSRFQIPGVHLERVLAIGERSILVKATDKITGEKITVKYFIPDPELLYILLTQFEFQKRLSGVVPAYRIGRAGRIPYITLPYYDHSLLDFKGTHALLLSDRIDLVRKVIEAVAIVHKQGVIHRDLKTENFLLDHKRSNVRLTDFDCAELLRAEKDVRCGTVGYRPPECDNPNTMLSKKRDVYSLAVVILELLNVHFNVPIITGANLEPSIRALASYPYEFRRLLSECSCNDPKYRYVDAEAVLKEFNRIFR